MDYDFESHELLQEAIDRGYIEENSDAHGVAKQCIGRGYDTLSEKQKGVYTHQVLPHLKKIVTDREIQDRMRVMPD